MNPVAVENPDPEPSKARTLQTRITTMAGIARFRASSHFLDSDPVFPLEKTGEFIVMQDQKLFKNELKIVIFQRKKNKKEK
mmetsp:Transcript_34614/g.45767  ORF Transcript_34614/g.45767 Transcript_34614/m.45767 type:complete len:81 (+) Transcript_34614:603-845(+)